MNPFVFGNPIAPERFIGRNNLLRRIFGKVYTSQSLAISGPSRIGKTSLLLYINDEQSRLSQVGERLKNFVFVYVDSMATSDLDTPTDFWERIFTPEQFDFDSETLVDYRKAFEIAKNSKFGSFTLESLIRVLEKTSIMLVVLLDEFDAYLTNPSFTSREFFGALRSMSSRYRSFSLILATRYNLSWLNGQTQSINPHGSPFFNAYTEYYLGPLTHKEFLEVIEPAKFSDIEKKYVLFLSGRHPYLTQFVSSEVWEYRNSHFGSQEQSHINFEELSYNILNLAQSYYFNDFWHYLSLRRKISLIAVSLGQIEELTLNYSKSSEFLAQLLVEDYDYELKLLSSFGIVKRKNNGNWEISQLLFLWWLIEKIQVNLENESSFYKFIDYKEIPSSVPSKIPLQLFKISNLIFKQIENISKSTISASLGPILN